MDGLTYRINSNAVNLHGIDEAKCDIAKISIARQIAFDRLAAYEDTGLTPEEIPQLKAQLKAAPEDLYYIHCAGKKCCAICRNSDRCEESDSHIGGCTGFE